MLENKTLLSQAVACGVVPVYSDKVEWPILLLQEADLYLILEILEDCIDCIGKAKHCDYIGPLGTGRYC